MVESPFFLNKKIYFIVQPIKFISTVVINKNNYILLSFLVQIGSYTFSINLILKNTFMKNVMNGITQITHSKFYIRIIIIQIKCAKVKFKSAFHSFRFFKYF